MAALLVVMLVCVLGAQGGTFMQGTVTVTNAPTTNGFKLTVNGTDRVFTNNTAAAPSTFVLTNLTIGGSASNLYSHLVNYPEVSPLVDLEWVDGSTNSFILYSQADEGLTVAVTGNWGAVVMATNTFDDQWFVKVPMFNSSEGTRDWAAGVV